MQGRQEDRQAGQRHGDADAMQRGPLLEQGKWSSDALICVQHDGVVNRQHEHHRPGQDAPDQCGTGEQGVALGLAQAQGGETAT